MDTSVAAVNVSITVNSTRKYSKCFETKMKIHTIDCSLQNKCSLDFICWIKYDLATKHINGHKKISQFFLTN